MTAIARRPGACSLLAGLLLLSAGAALAQVRTRLPHQLLPAPPPFPMPPLPFPPRLRVVAEKPIEIGALDVRVVIHGLHAETTQTVTFFNPNLRVLEGDLEFPLPDGATVSGYALDFGGVLVDGVVVTKEKARVVLETEIRKGVDPGLVEQVRGNLYRTRIYPIPARGTRTVRLTWVSDLTTRGPDAAYHLPLPYDRKIAEVSLRLEVVRPGVKPEVEGGFGNLQMKQWEDRWVAEAKWQGAAPARDLLVTLPKLPAQVIALEPGDGAEGGAAFFSASDTVPVRAAAPAAPPKRLALAWDASGSRTPEATERELAFLSALLAAWPHTAVDLVVFRDRPEKPIAFPAGNGGKALLETLRAAPVDGGTALAALDLTRAALPNPADELWLVLSDGLATLGEALPRHGDVRAWTATGASVADRGLLRVLAGESGGRMLDLVALHAAAATAAMTRPGLRLLEVTGAPAGAVTDLQIGQRADPERAGVTGRLLADEAELTLVYGGVAEVAERRTIKLKRAEALRAGQGAGPVATAWAQGRAEALSVFAERNGEELLGLGRRFGLVTANTSLLVLETLEQHLQHRVEPAATRPELRTQYLVSLKNLESQKAQEQRRHLDEVAQLWKERVAWWSRDYDVPKGWKYEEPREHKSARASGMAASAAPPPPSAAEPSRSNMMSTSAEGSGSEEQHVSNAIRTDRGGGGGRAARKAKEGVGESAEASIAIKAWDPQVPYLAPLRSAAPGAMYRAYLEQRKEYASPAFFLDCAELLLRHGERELGLRVLSNLAELRLDDPSLLRVLAWRLSQAGELDAASWVLEKVLRLRPEEPQSRRDLALVLADRAEEKNQPEGADRALALLAEVVQRKWDRFPEIELVAVMEQNRILARAERRGWNAAVHADRIDPRLRKLLDVDLRVSLSWDADLTDVDLHTFEPTGEHVFYGHNRSAIGGLVSHDLTQGYGPEEYLVKRALPGDYAVKVHYYGSRQQTLIGPATMVATVFTNWGRADEKKQILTLRLDTPREMEEVGVVTIGPGGPGGGKKPR